jgi:hypothetical protein
LAISVLRPLDARGEAPQSEGVYSLVYQPCVTSVLSYKRKGSRTWLPL